MTTDRFLQSIENTYKTGLELIKRKNQDYAQSDNPFKNFEFAEMVGVSTPRAILVRISDKLARIANLIDNINPAVTDETVEDTLLDLINYTAILKAYIEDKKKDITHNL